MILLRVADTVAEEVEEAAVMEVVVMEVAEEDMKNQNIFLDLPGLQVHQVVLVTKEIPVLLVILVQQGHQDILVKTEPQAQEV